MRRRVHLHGALKPFHPDPISVDVSTVAEAIELVTTQLPGFQPNAITGRKVIQIAGFRTRASLYAPTDVEDIHVFPAMAFGKNGGVLQTVIGVALIVASFFIPGGPGLVIGFLHITQTAVFLAGAAMVIGGLAQLLSPQPHATPENHSKYIAVTQNTVSLGTCVALLYGRRRVAGQILSIAVQSQSLT